MLLNRSMGSSQPYSSDLGEGRLRLDRVLPGVLAQRLAEEHLSSEVVVFLLLLVEVVLVRVFFEGQRQLGQFGFFALVGSIFEMSMS